MNQPAFLDVQAISVEHRTPTPVPVEDPPSPGPGPTPEQDPVPGQHPSRRAGR
jgi:hypothetical protein